MSGQVALQAALKTGQRALQSPVAKEVLEAGAQVVSESLLATGKNGATLADILGRLTKSVTQPEAVVRTKELISHVTSNVGATREFLKQTGVGAEQFEGVLKQLGELERVIGAADDSAIKTLLEETLGKSDLVTQLVEFDTVATQVKERLATFTGTDGASASGILEDAATVELGGRQVVVDQSLIDTTRTQVNGQRTEVIEKVLGGAEDKLANGVALDPATLRDVQHVADDFGVQAGDVGKKAVVPEANVTGQSTVSKPEVVDGAQVQQKQPQGANQQAKETTVLDDVDVDPTQQGADDFTRGKTADEPKVETSAEANTRNQEKLYGEDEIEQRVQERLKEIEAQGGKGAGNVPNDPIEKILHGAEQIVAGEFQNLSSEVGLLMKATGMTPEKVNGLMRKFVTPELRKDLETFLKAQLEGHQDPLSLISHLGKTEQQGIKWLGRLVNVGAKVPSWAFDTMAFAGNFVDYFDWALRKLPGGKMLLNIPFMRKAITGFGQFVGRFSGNIKLIGEGVKDFQGSIAKTSGTAMGAQAVGAVGSTASKQ